MSMIPSNSSTLLSKTWKIKHSHSSFYTGGKIILSANELFFITSHGDDIYQIDIKNGRILSKIESNDDGFITFALAPNDKDILIACKSGLIKHYKLDSVEMINSFRGHDMLITDMSIDPTGTLLATSSIDRSVRIWHINGGYCTHSLRNGHESAVRHCWFSNNMDKSSLTLISSDDEGGLCLWIVHTADSKKNNAYIENDEPKKKKKKTGPSVTLHSLKSHMNLVTSVAFSYEYNIMVSVGRDSVLNIWNLTNYELIRTIPIYEAIEAVCFVSSFPNCPIVTSEVPVDNLFCALAGENGVIRILHLKNGKTMYTQKFTEDVKLQPLSNLFVTSSGLCITVSSEHNFTFWDVSTFERKKLLVGYNDEIVSLKCFPSSVGESLSSSLLCNWAVVATNSDQIRLLNLHTFDTDMLVGHKDLVLGLDITADGKYVVSVSNDCSLRIWSINANNGMFTECIAVGNGHTEAIAALAASKKVTNSDDFFVVTGSKDRTIKLWPFKDIKDMSITPKYTIVAHDKDINAIAIAPNDRLIATASADKSIKLWNSDLTLAGILRGHKRGVWNVEFSKVDKVLASCSGDKTIRLWSMSDFTCLKTLEGHVAAVLSVSFISHGTQLLSTASDGVMKLWTLKTSECVNTFDEHQNKVWALALSEDGKHVITGGADSVINIWEDVTAIELKEENDKSVARTLQEQEFSNSILLKDYTRATKIALQLLQPRRLMTCLETMLIEENENISESFNFNSKFVSLFQSLTDDEQCQLIKFCRDWNTNAKHSAMAQRVISVVLHSLPPDAVKQIKEIKLLINALIPYSERHFARINTLIQKSYIIDFILSSMKKLSPMEIEYKN